MADEEYEHLNFPRTVYQNPRRTRPFGRKRNLDDPQKHAKDLGEQLAERHAAPPTEVPGFDERRLLKLTIVGISPGDLESIPGVSVVVQEGADLTVLFATEGGLTEFKTRLQHLADGRPATRKDVLFAIDRFEDVTVEDRTGAALAAEGEPESGEFTVDVELWPLERFDERASMIQTFRDWCVRNHCRVLDEVNNAAIVLVRIVVKSAELQSVLSMRDVRLVDLPPRFELEETLIRADIESLPDVVPPPDGAPVVCSLDSGFPTNHPVARAAIGDAQGFASDGGTGDDPHGHGTHVGALVLYGDFEAVLATGELEPEVRLLSARICENDGKLPTRFIENRVEDAVKYFNGNYGCKVFNLSLGDVTKPYQGGHVESFAATLDVLAREYGVLFVVSAGNYGGSVSKPANWREEYPDYLTDEDARILDPASALNVLTVGSLARHERPRPAVRSPEDPAFQPVARRDEPSPFSRSGPGPAKAIKPELVEYGGNAYVDARSGVHRLAAGAELGELSASVGFATGSPLAVNSGTSFAAPKVANYAARLLASYPDASPNLLRALLVAHAEVPGPSAARFGDNTKGLLQVTGYGRPRPLESRYSSERRVTLVSEESLPRDQSHFYEVPLPEDFFREPAKRTRRLAVGLSHMPNVRRSRLDYKEVAMSFRVIRAETLDEVVEAFRKLGKDEEIPSIGENGFYPGPQARGGGTVQAARREYKVVDKRQREKKLFVVVTNRTQPWVAVTQEEPYALTVLVEDLSETEVELYQQMRLELQARVRARA